jgi:hypothetical protein
MSLDVKKYKSELRQKLAKPSLLEEETKVETPKSYLVEGAPELGGGLLDDLRKSLFDGETLDPEAEPSVDPKDPDLEVVPDDTDRGEGIMLGDPTDGNDPSLDAGDKAPMDMGLEDGDGQQILHDAEEELGDLATDTVHEVLLYLKDLRDKFKQEDPKKAQLVRKMYDHILKGKEKIVAEMIKAEEEAGLPDTAR